MNITLRIPDELGKQAKHLAIDEGTTLSGLVTTMLEERLVNNQDSEYREVCDKAWKLGRVDKCASIDFSHGRT
ncbi:MAG: CopG family transcriptional regulator [Verrucomicrobiota bacterium]